MSQHEKRLLVEGKEDMHSIVELMGHHTDWPNDKLKAPVWLEDVGSPESMLTKGFIAAKLHESGTNILGVVFDADEQMDQRWGNVKAIFKGLFPDVPDVLEPGGLIRENADGKRLGVWMMPDNKNPGMLETFLQNLVRANGAPPIAYAKKVVVDARSQKAPCKDCHVEKAEIHSWLAWQDPPGQPLGRAITSLTLDPQAPSAKPFVKWFLDLYKLEGKNV